MGISTITILPGMMLPNYRKLIEKVVIDKKESLK
jgi:hypothetical protein